MTTCILCQTFFSSPLCFRDLFLMRKSREVLCGSCQSSFLKIGKNCCPTCQKAGYSEICPDCLAWQDCGHRICHTALYRYEQNMANYFVQYKQWGDYQLRFVFAKEIKEKFKEWKGYTIVPIPVSKQRYQERGFNQVEGILEAAEISYERILQKADVEHQIGKDRRERLAMEQVFAVKGKIKVQKGVILVDDVYTTGATMELAKKVLSENGCQNIFTFSIAR